MDSRCLPVSSPVNLFLIFHLNATIPPPNSIHINNQQTHSLLCASITPPEDELQHQLRKFVSKPPCPEEAFYYYSNTFKYNLCLRMFFSIARNMMPDKGLIC